MYRKFFWVVVGLAAVGLAAASFMSVAAAVAEAPRRAAATPVASTIGYQGQLTDGSGNILDGQYSMIFRIYDAQAGGSEVWNSGPAQTVTVSEGLFNVELDLDSSILNGQALWLEMTIDGEVLSPRQALLAAPYALYTENAQSASNAQNATTAQSAVSAQSAKTLVAGAKVQGNPATSNGEVLRVEMTGAWPNANTLGGYAPATGTAVRADANGGIGLSASSQGSYGVRGSSVDGWGGYFTSQNGYGLRVDTNGADHYDHGIYVTAQSGYGIYAQSANNMSIRGEAGDITGIPRPLGPIGVVGLGENRGVVASSATGTGLYATSSTNYGIWGQSTSYRGVTGRTARSDDNYGLYTPDNLFSKNVNLAGSIMQVVQNAGDAALEPGDVVAFAGVKTIPDLGVGTTSPLSGVPLVQVAPVSENNRQAVAGVIFSGFNIDAVREDAAGNIPADGEVNLPGPIPPGGYLLLVTHGPAQVKAAALDGSVQVGEPLVASGGIKGPVRTAASVVKEGGQILPGSVFAKALESTEKGREMIYVYVTLQ